MKRRSDFDHSIFILRDGERNQEVNQSKCKAETGPADKQVEDAQFPAVLQKAVCSAPAQKNGEVGTLLRVIGQAGLSRLGNDALAGCTAFSILKSLPRPLRIKGADLQDLIYQFVR